MHARQRPWSATSHSVSHHHIFLLFTKSLRISPISCPRGTSLGSSPVSSRALPLRPVPWPLRTCIFFVLYPGFSLDSNQLVNRSVQGFEEALVIKSWTNSSYISAMRSNHLVSSPSSDPDMLFNLPCRRESSVLQGSYHLTLWGMFTPTHYWHLYTLVLVVPSRWFHVLSLFTSRSLQPRPTTPASMEKF